MLMWFLESYECAALRMLAEGLPFNDIEYELVFQRMKALTPLEQFAELAQAIGTADVRFKREDLHPYGSHKGRSIPAMIDHYAAQGDRHFAVSSSGNAALAAALYVHELNAAGKGPFELDIYIGQHAAPHKADRLKALADEHVRVYVKERPKQALTQAVQEGARSLRQSTDDAALAGYESLAQELAATQDIGAVWIGTSSGTTAQALAAAFSKLKSPIQVHIVQTSSCHPLAQEFETYDGPDEPSDADAITDVVALRKAALVPLVGQTGGHGWTVTNDEIRAAQDLAFKHTGLEISPNSALSVAGLVKAVEVGWEFPGAAVCMICGE